MIKYDLQELDKWQFIGYAKLSPLEITMVTFLLILGIMFGITYIIGGAVGTIEMTYGVLWLLILGTSICFWALI